MKKLVLAIAAASMLASPVAVSAKPKQTPEEKLAKLPDADVLELHRSGALALLHAHLVSMGQFNALAQRLGAR